MVSAQQSQPLVPPNVGMLDVQSQLFPVSQEPVSRRLQDLLVRLKSSQQKCGDQYSDANEEKDTLKFDDVRFLFDALFTELDRRLKELYSALCKPNEEPYTNAQERIEEATLFLRCCLNSLTLLMSDQEVVLEKARALFSILSGFSSAELPVRNGDKPFVFTRSVSCGYTENKDGHRTSMAGDFVSSIYLSGQSDPFHSFVCTGLEVFMEEILVNKSIRDLLLIVDSAISSSRLFSPRAFRWHGIARVLEVVSAHLIFSLSGEKMIEACIDRLCWKLQNEVRTPQISLNAVLSLLLNPAMLSAPKMFQAYVVILVKDTIGINASSCGKDLDLQLIGCYLSAFERSIVLYTKQMCNFNNVGNDRGETSSSGKHRALVSDTQVAFEKLLLPSTLEKVNSVITKLNDSWVSYLSSISNRENAELVASSFAYAMESLNVYGSSCSEVMLSEILSILGCVILRACSDDVLDSALQKDFEASSQDLYLLGSSLKLMSCSLLQAISCLRDGKTWLSSVDTGGGSQAGKEYKTLMDTIQRFEQFSVSLPIQCFLRDSMEHDLLRQSKSKWMLIHFSGLLSLSYAHKLDFLMKDSIFAMVIALYIFVLEEGHLHVLRELVGGSVSSYGFANSVACDEIAEVASDKKSSQIIASKFQKTRTLCLGKLSPTESKNAENCSAVGVHEESCNGERFLRCVALSDNVTQDDIVELSEFIHCDPGKDYSDWLKGRERFRRRWKSEKMATCRWKKKKKAWRDSKRKMT